MSRPLPLFPSALALQLLSQAISYCPSWDKQVPSNEALAPGSLCPRPAGVTADLSPELHDIKHDNAYDMAH